MKLLYVGRVSKEKNLEILVRAFRTLEARGDNIDLIIVGDGPYKKEMASILNGSRVVFTGELSGETLARAYASSDVFVFPSTTDTFGNVVLEAQASGLPVVVSDKGGPQENLLPGETGFVVRSLDADAVAKAVHRLYQNSAELARMKKAARKYMEGRSFEENFLKTWNLFKNASGFVDPRSYVEDLVSAAS